jgi:hypothetical protein
MERYKENSFDKLLDPTLLVEDTVSVTSFIKLLSSWTTNTEFQKISKYAYVWLSSLQ